MARELNQRFHGATRRWVGVLLVIAVTLAHLALTWFVEQRVVGWGHARNVPVRLQASFVRELVAAAPPAVAPVPRPRPAAARAAKSAPAASSPAPSIEPEVNPAAQAPPEIEAPPQPPAVAASEPEASTQPSIAAAEAAQAPVETFDWPASTRLTYVITGYYRGEVYGSAQVEWVRAGDRYQVHLDVILGPSFAPLLTRRMSSDGLLGAEGLSPRRYDEETRAALGAPRHATVHFERDAIVLANGQRRDTLAGVQDAASQFVQLTWLFTTQPHRLRAGNTIEVPLALPRNVDRWTYDVLEEETLYAAFGPVKAFHLKPRRERPLSGQLTIDTWFAPALQYLPVRIRIRQDEETFIDMMIERPPQQAAEEAERPSTGFR